VYSINTTFVTSCNATNVRALLIENGLSLCRSPFILLWGNLIQTEPSIGASHQSSAHLAKQFQKKSIRNRPIRNKNCLWRPCLCLNKSRNSHCLYRYQVTLIVLDEFLFSNDILKNNKKFWLKNNRNEIKIGNRIGSVMVSVLASSTIDCGYELRSCQTKEYKIGNRDQMSNLYRRLSIVASYQVSLHLVEAFQRRRLKCE
jgi:hypothetical protein